MVAVAVVVVVVASAKQAQRFEAGNGMPPSLHPVL